MTVTSGSAARDDRPLLDRIIERLSAVIHADLRESADRLLAVRTPAQAQRALEDEYEHVLRRVLPLVIDRPLLRNVAAASAFTATFAALAASAEEADELLTLMSVGTLAAPSTSVVVAVGLVAAVAETYAAASVRVHQLRENFVAVDPDQLAADVRIAVFGSRDSKTVVVTKRMIDGAAARISTRWIVGAVPFVGIGYAAYDSARTVQRVRQLPIPTISQRDR